MNQFLDDVKAQISDGHTMEVAALAKRVAYAMPEQTIRALTCLLADAILQPVKRKRGDRFGSSDKFADLRGELSIVLAVEECKGTRADAYESVGKACNKSAKTVEGYCTKWRNTST